MKYTLENYAQEKYESDKKIVDTVDKSGISFNSIYGHVITKENILRNVLGYKKLRIGSNKSEIRFLEISRCKPERINQVLQERYYSALNRINKFGNPSEKNKEKGKGLEYKIERTGQGLLF